MSRNASLALGRPTPSLGLLEIFGGLLETVTLIAAAGRVGAAVEARQQPSQADLRTAGLEGLGLSRPSRPL